jgi:hypothetical protein
MEPTVENRLNWRFTHRHSPIFSSVYSHNADPTSTREVISPPLVPPHVPALDPDTLIQRKSKLISAIGSKQTALEFHKVRTLILDRLEASPESGIDVFGKGRNYIENKLEGLIDYKYSIAIENSLTEHYWTEKISDCFLTLTVPVYLGSPNVSTYFPEASTLVVTRDDLEVGLNALLKRLSDEDYESRIPALLSSRNLILNQYNLGKQVAVLLGRDLTDKVKRIRFSRVWTLDSAVSFIFQIGAFIKGFIKGVTRHRL